MSQEIAASDIHPWRESVLFMEFLSPLNQVRTDDLVVEYALNPKEYRIEFFQLIFSR